MSLTLPSVYSTATSKTALQENWIFQLYYYDGADRTNFTGIALNSTTVGGVFYEGCISNVPKIRESINLSDSTSKTSNISVNLANFNFNGADFSEELYGGTNKYHNSTVKIYSQLDDESTLANCLQIYEGRLVDISHDGMTIDITIEAQKPWDFISIPQEKTTGYNVYVPVAYGAFTPNNNTYWGNLLYLYELDKTTLRPCPFLFSQDTYNYYVSDISAKADSRAEYWDKSLGYFIPINDSTNSAITTSISKKSQYVTKTLKRLERAFKTRPAAHATTATSGQSIYTSSLSNIYNTNLNDAGSFNLHATTDSYIIIEFYNTPSPDGDFSQGKIYLQSYWDWISGNNLSKMRVSYSLDNSSYTMLWEQAGTNGDRAATTDNFTITEFPEKLYIKVEYDIFSAGDILEGVLYIHDIRYAIEQITRDDQTKMVYIGADGFVNSWDSSAISYGHEAHRDLLIRYTGYTTTAPDNWSALNTDRSIGAWRIRWWALEPVELKKVLEQLQYEFGFIFKFRPDGTGSYIYIKQTSELSAVQTLNKKDIDKLKISNTPFSDLLTKMEFSYKKHPAENRYISSITSSNSTARTNWNIQTKENISKINLDMNVGTPRTTGQTDVNNDFYSYYDNIFGTIKKTVSCEIVNPAKGYGLETGDIIQFSDMPVNPFGDNWADYYMITELQRSPGQIKIQVREVG